MYLVDTPVSVSISSQTTWGVSIISFQFDYQQE